MPKKKEEVSLSAKGAIAEALEQTKNDEQLIKEAVEASPTPEEAEEIERAAIESLNKRASEQKEKAAAEKKAKQKQDKKLDDSVKKVEKLLKESGAQPYTRRLSRFCYYLLDYDRIVNARTIEERHKISKRGVIEFATYDSMMEFYNKNKKVLEGFKPLAGKVILSNFLRLWMSVRNVTT